MHLVHQRIEPRPQPLQQLRRHVDVYKRQTLIHEVSVITDETYKIAGGAGSSMGTGGMYTKIKAAHMATNSGIHMIIASGESDNSLRKVCKGENIGTLFVANDQGVSQKHHWVCLLYTSRCV